MKSRTLETSFLWVSRSGLGTAATGLFAVITSMYWRTENHVTFLALLLCSLYASVTSAGRPRLSNMKSAPIGIFVMFLGWILLSAFWSPQPRESFSYGLIVVIVAVASFLLGRNVSVSEAMRGLAIGIGFLALHATVVDFPFDFSSSPGNFSSASSWTVLLGLFVLACLFAGFTSKAGISVVLVAIFLAGAALFRFGILTPFFALFVAGYWVLALSVTSRLSGKITIRTWRIVVGGFLAIPVFALLALPQIFSLFGVDFTFSGRMALWQQYAAVISVKPVIGLGWGFTTDWAGRANIRVFEFFPAHNVFLDAAMSLGLVGTCLLALVLASLFTTQLAGWKRVRIGFSSFAISTIVLYLTFTDLMSTNLIRIFGFFLLGLLIGLHSQNIEDVHSRSKARQILLPQEATLLAELKPRSMQSIFQLKLSHPGLRQFFPGRRR